MSAEENTLEALVHAYSKDLYRYGYWLCHDRETAEDLVQETFLRAWRAIDTLENPKAAKSWLFTILRRENARRFAKKSTQMEITDLDENLMEVLSSDGHSFTTADCLTVQNALHQIPGMYTEPLVLQILGGYSCNEIASIMNIKPGAVMTRVFRAKQKLREYLHADEEKVSGL